MVEKTNTPSDFVAQMMNLQQQFMNNLGQMMQSSAPASMAGQSPLEAWWQQFPSSGQQGFDDFFKQMAQASLNAMQTPNLDLSSMLQSGQLPADWMQTLQTQFSEWTQSGVTNPVFEQMNEQFRQQMLKPFGLDALETPFNPAALMDSNIVKLLQNLFGGEEKLAGQQLLGTLEAYQQQVMQMNHMMAQVGIDSIKSLQDQFEAQSDTDLKQVYESWMGVSKKIFNELKLDDRYKELTANMHKLEAKLTADMTHYREALLEQFGLVSRQEHDALKKELAELKAEVAALVKGAANAPSKTQAKPAAKKPEPAAKPAQQQAEQPAEPEAEVKGADGVEINETDDFTVLNGIGAKFNEKLHEQGVHTLQQLASMSDEMLKALDDNLNTNGRMMQQQWREQAEQLLNNLGAKK